MENFRPDPNIDRIRLKIFGFSMKARELFFFDKIRIESILEKRNGNNQRNEKDQSNWWYRFERLIEMGIQMIEYLDSRDSFLILLIKNTHFFEGSNRWIINLIETTISNARTNAQKIFCKIKMGIKGYSYTYIYIYCSPEMISRYEIRRCQFEQRTILSLFDSLSIGKFMGALIVDPENCSSLIIVVVVAFSRHWLLSWFAWFIVIMVAAFEILGDHLLHLSIELLSFD